MIETKFEKTGKCEAAKKNATEVKNNDKAKQKNEQHTSSGLHLSLSIVAIHTFDSLIIHKHCSLQLDLNNFGLW